MSSYLGGFDSDDSGPSRGNKYTAPAPARSAPAAPKTYSPPPAQRQEQSVARTYAQPQARRSAPSTYSQPAQRPEPSRAYSQPAQRPEPVRRPEPARSYSQANYGSPFASPQPQPQQVYRGADFGNNAISFQSANGANDPPPQYGSRPLWAASGYGANPTPGGLVTGAGVAPGQTYLDRAGRRLLGDSYAGRAGNEGTPVPQDGTPIQGRQDYNTQLANSNFGINRGKPVYVRGRGWTFPYGRGDGENRQTAPIYASDTGRQEGWRPSQGQVSYDEIDEVELENRRMLEERGIY